MSQPSQFRPATTYRPAAVSTGWSGPTLSGSPDPEPSPTRASRHQPSVPPPKRRRSGALLFGVPVTLVVAVEVVLACLIVVDKRKVEPAIVAIVIAGLVLLLVVLRRRGTHVGTWLALRLGFRFRQRDVLVAATEFGGEPSGRGVDHIDVPAEVHAFFPGVVVWETSTHEGERLGVVQWRGGCSATIELSQPGGILRPRKPLLVPAETIIEAIDGRDLSLDAVQILTTTVLGEADAGTSATVTSATSELYANQSKVRNRNVYVTVRIDPATAAAAITARGGGREGIGRLLAAALSAIRAGVVMKGLQARPLDSADATRAIADSLYHQATSYDPIIQWTESAHDISSTRMAHGSYAVTDVGGSGSGSGLVDIPAGNVFAYAVGTQVRPVGSGRYASTTVLRVSCKSRSALHDAGRELRRAARRTGVTLRPIDALQNLGLRATVPIGGV
jgi:type VII secretion protein EccE